MITRSAVRNLTTQTLNVVNDVPKQRFTVSLSGQLAVLDYRKDQNKITFVHTEVPRIFEGRGVGKLMAKTAFDYARDNSLDIECKCHFLARYYKANMNSYPELNVTFDE